MFFKYFNHCQYVLLIALLIFSACDSRAATFINENRIIIPQNDTLDDDLYALGQDGIVNGYVANDVIALVQRQNINGVIGGSLISCSYDAIIRGEVKNSANLFAYKLYVDGNINNNLTAFAYEIEISSESQIGKDATLQAEEISIAGDIGRNLIVEADRVVISGKILGNVRITGDEITIAAPAEIAGNLYYKSSNEILIDEDIAIGGDIEWEEISKNKVTSDDGIDWGARIFFMFAALLTGLIIIPIFNKHTRASAMQIINKPLVTLGIGFISICVAPIAMIFIFITIIGIPASVFLFMIYLIFLYIGKIYVAIAIGWIVIRAFRKGAQPRQGWSLLVGLIILMLLFSIPIVGLILYFVTAFFGFGAVILGINQCRIEMGNNTGKNIKVST